MSGRLFSQCEVNKSWLVIMSLGFGRMMLALYERSMTRIVGGGVGFIITVSVPRYVKMADLISFMLQIHDSNRLYTKPTLYGPVKIVFKAMDRMN